MIKKILWVLGSPVAFVFVIQCVHLIPPHENVHVEKKSRKISSIASIQDQLADFDPRKKTVCTVTINSSNEKDVFKKYLRDFNFIELADPGDGLGEKFLEDWLKPACNKKFKCDVLVVSGHFGGSFFGSSGLKLTVEGLEEKSCQKSCNNVLEAPKEVFLFGCNTLAGKAADRRTQDEYIRVLRADGIPIDQAQMIAAFRYSPIGQQYSDRMSRIFSGAKRLYGFDSIAPSGKSVERLLESYFKLIPDYNAHLDSLSENKINTAWNNALKITSHMQIHGKPMDAQDGICLIHDPSLQPYRKLAWISRVMQNEHSLLENMPAIDTYIQGLTGPQDSDSEHEVKAPDRSDGMVEFERRLRNEISANASARKIFEKYFVVKNEALLRVQIAMIGIGRYVGWWNRDQVSELARKILGDFRQSISQTTADLLCSVNFPMPYLTLSDFPGGEWSVWDVQAISCLGVDDIGVLRKLTRYVDLPFAEGRISGLERYDPIISANVLKYFRTFTKNNDGSVGSLNLLKYLTSGPNDINVTQWLIELLGSNHGEVLIGPIDDILGYFTRHQIFSRDVFQAVSRQWAFNNENPIFVHTEQYLLATANCGNVDLLREAESQLRKSASRWKLWKLSHDENEWDTNMEVTDFSKISIISRKGLSCSN